MAAKQAKRKLSLEEQLLATQQKALKLQRNMDDAVKHNQRSDPDAGAEQLVLVNAASLVNLHVPAPPPAPPPAQPATPPAACAAIRKRNVTSGKNGEKVAVVYDETIPAAVAPFVGCECTHS